MADLTLPDPTTPDPGDAPVLRWGIIAPGGIAHAFATALRGRTRQEVRAVGSRSLARAQAFADEVGAHTAYGSYEQLVADPDVDVVYIASPHSEHHAHALLALRAGKPVLVEKAFARNASEALEMVEHARAAGVFAMEAMWTRFLPHIGVLRQALGDGLLGEVHTLIADHGQQLYPDGPRRLADPALAGGALLDLGVYPVSLASLVLGDLTSAAAARTLTTEGVDAQEGIVVRNASGALGLLSATMLTRTPTTATIAGTRARLELDGPFYGPTTMRLVAPDGQVLDRFEPADRAHGLAYEAAEVARLVSAGQLESALMPLEETLRIMAVMDSVRVELGVRYPGE